MLVKGKDLKSAIVQKIHTNFEDKVLDSEAKEDIKKPYFFVYFEHFERESYSNGNDKVVYSVVVQYQKSNKLKLMEIGEKLSEIFNYSLKLQDLYVLIENNSWDIEDNALYFTFDIGFYVDKIKNEIDYKLMNEIFMNYRR